MSTEQDRTGWYEFVTADRRALTCIAYVQESGDVYLPEGGDPADFLLADASGRAWRLVREVDLARLTAVAEAARALHGDRFCCSKDVHARMSALGAALKALDGGSRG